MRWNQVVERNQFRRRSPDGDLKSTKTMTSRNRLLYITTVGQTQLLFLRGQNDFLSNHGFELHAIASPDLSLEKLRQRDGVQIHPVKITRKLTPLRDLVSLVRIYIILRRVRPTIVHVSTPKAAFLGSVAATLARVTIRVFLVRGLATETAHGWRSYCYRWVEWATSMLCHRTLFVATSLRQFAWSERIVPYGRGQIVAKGMSNGVDIEYFNPSSISSQLCNDHLWDCGESVIGFVGRLARDKGLEDLTVAWSILREEYPQSQLMLVGDWEQENPVRQEYRKALEEDPRVLLTGRVSDVRPFLKKMTLLVLPSHGTEGFPNAIMEAAAMQLPVVASRVVGCVDGVEEGVTGAVVPPHDADALAAGIRAYLDDPELRRQHGRAGRARVVRDFQSQAIWQAMLAEYRALLEERGIDLPTAQPQYREAA